MGLEVLNKAATQMEPNVMDVAPTITLGDPTTPIGVTSPNVKFMTNWATLQSSVLNSIHRMPPSIVLQSLLARTKFGYLIRPFLIISRVIFPTYLFTPNMMELTKNLISVHHLSKQNNVLVEFHHFHFLVKNKITRAILLRGACNNGIYTFPTSMVA
ncbi:hypothetical protein CK203_039004 [Vitis vinifera]|uniref:Uncharacterized protein n=1 Tax=Vitis vinifera TaxID=29760 RepID=A0A438HLP2_VITVI|nr:hypothetical protein CK203_039004 [Vitis vinifera]